MRVVAALLVLAACGKKAAPPPQESVEMYVVDPGASATAAPGARAPFPATPSGASGTYWQIPTEHADALREFASGLSAPAGRRVLVGPSAREGFSRTYVVEDPARVARACVAAMERGEGETTVELASPACAAKVSGDVTFVVVVDGRVIGAEVPGSAVDGVRIVVETGGAAGRN
jgi:hypothetical protein